MVAVKAIACELPARLGLPLARLHVPDIRAEVIRRGLAASISETTIWRWLSEDAIKPWTHRSWIFPRDPDFAAKAARVLDLYAGEWEDQPLESDEFVISADEKASIQARIRCHPTVAATARHPLLVEFEYERGGALQYLAAWDVHRAKLVRRCEQQTGIEPYRSARRVFWVLDNGSSHRGRAAVARLQDAYPCLVPVHLPVHASWLNQIEIYFSILERKVLTPPVARGARRPDPRLPGPLRGPRRAVRVEVHPSRSRQAPRPPGVARCPPAVGGGVNTSPNIRATALRWRPPVH